MNRRRYRSQSSVAVTDELMSLPSAARSERIRSDQMLHSVKLARHLTERSAAALPESPDDAIQLGSAALQILEFKSDSSLALRASCSVADAWRLVGDCERAEQTLSSAVGQLYPPHEFAYYLRSFAILHWEQGRSDEAVGLLLRAEQLFRKADLPHDDHGVNQLLVLLHAELNEFSDAIAAFLRPAFLRQNVTNEPASPRRPWLEARAALTAAFCLAQNADSSLPDSPSKLLALGEALTSSVQDPSELFHLHWLHARAKARLGHYQGIESVLFTLRRRTTPDSLYYYLLTLDLLTLRVAGGQGQDDLLKDRELLPHQGLFAMPSPVEPFLVGIGMDNGANPWGLASSLASVLYRTWRLARRPFTPLPFA